MLRTTKHREDAAVTEVTSTSYWDNWLNCSLWWNKKNGKGHIPCLVQQLVFYICFLFVSKFCSPDVLNYAFLHSLILNLSSNFKSAMFSLLTEFEDKHSKFKQITMALEINFPIECLEDIFRHLDCNDLLQCTLVIPEWNSFIGSTLSCMKKMKLKCPSNDPTQAKKKRIFMNTSRKYERLELSKKHSKRLTEILLPICGTLAQVTLYMHFQTANHFLSFLEIFQSSVQELDMTGATVNKAKIQSTAKVMSPELQFP